MYCKECGTEISNKARMCPKCGNYIKYRGALSTCRLVIGILSIVFSLVILLQSFAAGVVNTLEPTGDVGGTAGFFVAILFIASGIVGIVTRNSRKKVGPVTCFFLYIFSGLLGASNSAVYTDLQIWSGLAVVFGVIFLISGIKTMFCDNCGMEMNLKWQVCPNCGKSINNKSMRILMVVGICLSVLILLLCVTGGETGNKENNIIEALQSFTSVERENGDPAKYLFRCNENLEDGSSLEWVLTYSDVNEFVRFREPYVIECIRGYFENYVDDYGLEGFSYDLDENSIRIYVDTEGVEGHLSIINYDVKEDEFTLMVDGERYYVLLTS